MRLWTLHPKYLDAKGLVALWREALLAQKNIVVEFTKPRNARFKYRFITEELFEHEMDDVHVKGMFTHFTYEEFHPNHDYDLRYKVGRIRSRQTCTRSNG